MKPSWDDAPEWASWLAQNRDGGWYWFEHEPVYAVDEDEWYSPSFGGFMVASLSIDWRETKSCRP